MISKYPVYRIKENLIGFLISPWFLALLVAVTIILFLPPVEKYKAEQVKKSVANKIDAYTNFFDLNNDGYSEKIILFNSQKGEAAVKIIDTSDVQIHWMDYHGIIYPGPPLTGDADHDDKPEIYFISYSQDSLFLNITFPDSDKVFIQKQKFVDQIHLDGKMDDYRVFLHPLYDLQLDGSDELLFDIHAGYSLQPRRLYAYDLKSDSVYKGPLMGSQVTFFPVQLDDDPYPEFLGQGSSSDNIPAEYDIPYKDSSSWLMALDHKLDFLFEPVEFTGHKSFIQCQKMVIDGGNYILALYEKMNTTDKIQCLMLFSTMGELIRKRDILPTGVPENYFLIFQRFPDEDRIIIGTRNGEMYTVDKNLGLTKTGKTINQIHSSLTMLDLDRDGLKEIIFSGSDCESFCILRNDLSFPVYVAIPFDRSKILYFSSQENRPEQTYLFVQQGDREMWFTYGFNPWWYLKFPVWMGIYFLVLGFIYVIRRFQALQYKKVKARENQLARIQLDQMSSYLDPHFTFNILNTISSLIYKEEKVRAHEILTRFTSLIRAVLSHSGNSATTLENELWFVKDYLDIQMVRYNNIFEYTIHTYDGIDVSLPVPKMMIQQYAENAVKHGLKNRGPGGMIKIAVAQKDGHTSVTIRDNGIGREKAKEYAEMGTGRGMSTLEQVYELFEKTQRVKITPTITDLKDETGKATGTEVNLKIEKL